MASSAPSEFSRMFSAMPPAPTGNLGSVPGAAPAIPAIPTAAPKTPWLILALILGGLLVVALVVILLFALKR
jgi:hypothetical protein